MGNEFNLLVFNVIVYAFFDMISGSTLVGIALTYIIDKLYSEARSALGRRNIA